MLAGTRLHTRARRGIVLVLVLAMLGLLALIGVTFATFSGQARINARNFAQSVMRPQGDELMDFAVQQLITDTADVRSVIRGHSLARDMFGNDAVNNGYLAANPSSNGGPLLISNIKQSTTIPGAYDVLTNLRAPANNAPEMYGYNFTRWIMRVTWTGGATATAGTAPNLLSQYPVSQTCEVLVDDYLPGQNNTQFSGQGYHAFRITPLDSLNSLQHVPPANTPLAAWPGLMPNLWTVLNNPTLGWVTQNAYNPFPGWPANGVATPMALTWAFNGGGLGNVAFTLDGRWLHAFNGPGLGTQTSPVSYGNLTLNVPLSTYGNFRYNGLSPNAVGMDEDYDACDLENWFLAIQSADGQVIIPSFHRPGVVRHDPNNPTAALQASDWDPTFRTTYWADSAPRILRPVAADGHDPATFHDLVPDPTTGKIPYDVDNDGDGITDSVWLDLGYPARRDANGVMYKPLFAFMVIGLNGRIPLNTAGNLASGSATHAKHLGSSVSEIDPSFGLQNGYNGDGDPFNAASATWPPTNTSNTQVDNSQAINNLVNGIDVRLTQLRNLLAGTRPHTNPLAPDTTANGDADAVLGSWPGTGPAAPYYLPNSIVDPADLNPANYQDGNGNPLVARTTPPVAGRWGEAASIPGVPFTSTGISPPPNLVQTTYANPVRGGYSFDIADVIANASYSNVPFPRDAADDNYNAYDVYPAHAAALNRVGEFHDLDFYDAAGALLLPVERMRRFVTPIDINGTGSVLQWRTNDDRGPDNFGRVQFNSYFRPAGVAGPINISPNPNSAFPYGAIDAQTAGPAARGYGSWNLANGRHTLWTLDNITYQPDLTNNPLHGYESYKLPNQFQVAGAATPGNPNTNLQRMGGMPIDRNGDTNYGSYPLKFPTYNNAINSSRRLDGVNEADEMNLYSPNPLLDSPYGPSDLEWLYRQQDVDGTSLTSRLARLAPISFTNTIDGQRRRRLFALDSWETNNFVWTNDNPGNSFANNARFNGNPGLTTNQIAARWGDPSYPPPEQPVPINLANAGFASLSAINYVNTGQATQVRALQSLVATPSLAHREKKINLNFPLPVSNDPNEPIRQKWITDTYQLLRVVLPPTSVDTPEELAQLSQFVINIVDFRDPDATMTHWVNPDVWITPSTATGPSQTYPTLSPASVDANSIPLDQYGMEYNPVAINEVLAYAFQSRDPKDSGASSTYTSRIFIELVNTLTAAYNPTYLPNPSDPNNYYGYGTSNTGGNNQNSTAPPYQASTLDLGGFTYNPGDPYSGGCWDLVFTADNPMSRPDPYRGDLVYNPSNITYYGLIPLNRDAVSASGGAGGENTAAPNGGDVTLLPLSPTVPTVSTHPVTLPTTQTNPPTTYFYVIGSPTSANEVNSISTTSGTAPYSCMTQYIATNSSAATPFTYDPMNTTLGSPTIKWYPGILPVPRNTTTMSAGPSNFQWKFPTVGNTGGPAAGSAQYYWVCLRRPANPFAPVSAANPMVVVDSMRFPYMDGSPAGATNWKYDSQNKRWYIQNSPTPNTIYSTQRLQPYRGGHAVPMPNATPGAANPQGLITSNMPPDPRYGYTEQVAVQQPSSPSYNGRATNTYGSANIGMTGANTPASTNYYYHTLGYINDGAENWDYFPFNDRDFSSVAELLLVPGCPPGLFTKQFVEFAPSQMNAADIFGAVTPVMTPTSPKIAIQSLPNNTPPTSNANGTGLAPLAALTTGTVPFLSVSEATRTSALGTGAQQGATMTSVPAISPNITQSTPTTNDAVQPHAFPYLVDKFFYTGASTFYYPPAALALDPGSPTRGNARTPVVGGPGGDGWFKMFEFFEVPSQMTGAVGPVAQGVNFDWARQDFKPGLMNLNLVIDEEAFYGIFASQDGNYGENLLNSIELPLLSTFNANTGQYSLPYAMPLANMNSGAPPIPRGGPPVPLVVSAIQVTGGPNYVYPVTDQTQLVQHGYLAGTDPIQQAINAANNAGGLPAPGNRIKAAFAQFLWARHGGSGYIFGFGNGNTGENSAVPTLALTQSNGGYSQRIPAERPFRSLSFPDINYTIMRPAALPPSPPFQNSLGQNLPGSNPAMLVDPRTNPQDQRVYTASALYTQQTPTAGSFYFLAQDYYSPFVTNNNNFSGVLHKPPIVYTGDPGVRNPFFNQGYETSAVVDPRTPNNKLLPGTTTAYQVYPNLAANSLPAGVPIPVNVAFPSSGTPIADSIVMPPPIPPARLFQPPDAYGAGQMQIKGYTGIYADGSGNIPPAVSNATDSGDPWINNLVANQSLNWTAALPTPSYTLSNGFSSLIWPWPAVLPSGPQVGGVYYAGGGSTWPMLTPTGTLPPASISYPPYSSGNLASSQNLILNNSYGQTSPKSATAYLGAGSAGSNTDDRQHPYWRTELLQRAMNLTTVRTHQYAVWITVGFFEVKRQGDIAMLVQGLPQLAFDILGPEVGALNGQNVRYRGFFLVDRLKLTGFNPNDVGAFHNAVVYRKVIQ